ncbi:ABC transporter substrate-binding protein [Nitrincola alkalilacustris]|uniref:ABC transporter substrate-binding protein n=1 Tax=Nitrincola alkalilacustris TaxID=1571224 RepID=UPI00124D4449|nr:ABC transporter substrate-binding protein [Nitrincola alkalilacustris]
MKPTKNPCHSSDATAITRRRFLQGTAGLGAMTLLPMQVWASGNTLRIRTYTEPDNFDPVDASGFGEEMLYGCIYRKLIQYVPGEQWGYDLDLAEKIEQRTPTEIAFTLKKRQMWSDGYGEITSEDIKFSFERILDPAMKSSLTQDLGSLTHVEITGTHSGVLHLDRPFSPIWGIALPYLAGTIVCKKAVEAVGGRITTAIPPTVSGPYRVRELRTGDRWILERNPEYSGPQADFERVDIVHIDDALTAEIGLEAGNLEFTRVSPGSVLRLRRQKPAGTMLTEHPSLYYAWLGMNLDSPKLSDIRVRQAIQYAIDVPSTLTAAYSGSVESSTGIIAPGLVGHRNNTLIPPEGDLEIARLLLDQAGVSTLNLRLDVLNTSVWTSAAQVIQATAGAIGINIEIHAHESGSFWSLGKESDGDRWKNLELVLNRFSMAPDPYYATSWFTTEQVGIWNWERFSNKEFDQLHQDALAETDNTKRHEMYVRMQNLMEESGAYRFLTHESTANLYVSNVVPATRPDGLPLIQLFRKA